MPKAFRFEDDMKSSSITKAALAWARQGAKTIALHGIDENGACTCGKHQCGSPGKRPIADLFPKRVSTAPRAMPPKSVVHSNRTQTQIWG